MPPFLNNIADYGLLASVMAFTFWMNWFLVSKSIDRDKASREADTKLLRELTDAVIQSTRDNSAFNALHNERSMAFQQRVSDAHEAMMREVTAVMQILCVQNEAIIGFKHDTEWLKDSLNKLTAKCDKLVAK